MKWIKANEDNFKGVNHDNAMTAPINQAHAYLKLLNSVCKSNQELKTNFKFIETKLDQMYNLNKILNDSRIPSSLKDSDQFHHDFHNSTPFNLRFSRRQNFSFQNGNFTNCLRMPLQNTI